jgi:hypothetical protein
MSEDINTQPTKQNNEVLQQSSIHTPASVPSSIVPAQQSLSPQEIERICKAFIRLITAKETRSNGK